MKPYGDQVLPKDGTASLPGYSFLLDPDTGMYRPGANRVGWAVGGAATWEIDAAHSLVPANPNDIGTSVSPIGTLWATSVAGILATLYTPALTALTTNPTLGSGSSASGGYFQFGSLIAFWAMINFGTSGTNAGSGQYRVSLPVPASSFHSTRAPLGNIACRCAGQDYVGVMKWTTGTTGNLQAGDSRVPMTHAVPGAWTANDEVFVNGSYIAA